MKRVFSQPPAPAPDREEEPQPRPAPAAPRPSHYVRQVTEQHERAIARILARLRPRREEPPAPLPPGEGPEG